jgi:hypothetical protein
MSVTVAKRAGWALIAIGDIALLGLVVLRPTYVAAVWLVAITALSFGWAVTFLSTHRLKKDVAIAVGILTAVILFVAWVATHLVAL